MNNEDELLELLAELEHEQWAHWTQYFLDTLQEAIDHYYLGGYDIQLTELKSGSRWKRQINTPYKDLTEKEKDSDRVWARKVLELIKEHTNDQ